MIPQVPLCSDYVSLALFLGYLVLAGDTGGRRSGDEWSGLPGHRASSAAVSEARASALLPWHWALLSRSLLYQQ